MREKPVAFEKDKRIPSTTSEFHNDVLNTDVLQFTPCKLEEINFI